MLTLDYTIKNPKTVYLEDTLTQLIKVDLTDKRIKEQAFVKRLQKRRNAIHTFLHHKEFPTDYKASERGIRNVKVTIKISNQFKA
jgi:hypothetical protein